MRTRAALCAFCTSLALMVAAPAARAGESTAKEGGLGMAAAITTLVYSPLKMLYAIGGPPTSGLAWLFTGGDSGVAKTVLTRSVRGTYVVTPAALQGHEPLEFVGRSPDYRTGPSPSQVAAAPEAW
jgi:hypothetical protein